MVTFERVTASLDIAKHPYHVIEYPGDVRLVISQYGGRLYGPFVAGQSLSWINPALADSDTYTALVEHVEWNLGGERLWIAPELQYNIADRNDFWGTHNVPPQMDPGGYTLEGRSLNARMELQAYNLATDTAQLTVKRTITPCENPLRTLHNSKALMDEVTFAGYDHTVNLTQHNRGDAVSEAWSLVQLNPGGQLFIPTTGSAEATVYFGDAPAQARNAANGVVRVNITGQQQFKVGYKAATLTGRMGYLNTLPDGRSYLLVRNFFNDPATMYAEEPPLDPGNNGHSVHVYNDDGGLGGFGEMECNGRTVGGATGRVHGTDVFTMWVYIGSQARLSAIASVLLGVTL